MALTETLQYDCATVDTAKFVDAAGGGAWNAYEQIVSGRLQLTCRNDYAAEVKSTNTYDFTGSYFELQVVTLPTVGNGTTEAEIQVRLDGSNFLSILINNGNWNTTARNAGVDSGNFGTYNSTNHKYIRIYNSTGTTVLFQGSADGTTWTTLDTRTVTFTKTAVRMHIATGYYGTETSPGNFIVDNINLNGSIVVTKTQTAIARIANNKTKTQSAIARIANNKTKTQSAIARVSNTRTLTQTATARISAGIIVTKTQSAIARIANSLTKTQSAIARIANNKTKTQSAISRISNNRSLTQTAVAKIASSRSTTITGKARVANTRTKTQTGLARIKCARQFTQTATAYVLVEYRRQFTQSATARIAVDLFEPPTIDAVGATYKDDLQDRVFPTTKAANALFRHFKARAVGQTVLGYDDGSYKVGLEFTQDEIDAARVAYVGGHIYTVNSVEANRLIAAGFDVRTSVST